jgi:uncharacterized membrane protein YeaQ/YmgE (transglycosylase-associated protein family)
MKKKLSDKVVIQKSKNYKRTTGDLIFKKSFTIPCILTLIFGVLCEFLSQALNPQVGFYMTLIGHTLFIVLIGQFIVIAFYTVKMLSPLKVRHILLIIFLSLCFCLTLIFILKSTADLYLDLPAALSQEYCIKEGYVTKNTTSNKKEYKKMDLTIGNDNFVIDNFYFMNSFKEGSFYRIYYLKNSRFVMKVLTTR